MKINGNHKNGSQKELQTSTTDSISKKAVAVVEETPLQSFDAQSTWEKLAKRMSKVDKRFVTWGFAMAASFSLLVAANIEMLNWEEMDNSPDQTLEVSSISSEEIVLELPKKPEPVAIVERIKPQAPQRKEQLKQPDTPAPEELSKQSKTILLIDKQEKKHVDLYPLSNPFVSVFAKVNFESGGITPEIGLDFKLAENYTARRRDIYKLGISSQLNFRTNEEGERKMHPHTFVNLEFTSLNKKTNKGWTTRAGYLLNPDGYLYQDTTIKVSVFRNIGKHIKLGPEVIFTDNLKQAYPSLSLVLG